MTRNGTTTSRDKVAHALPQDIITELTESGFSTALNSKRTALQHELASVEGHYEPDNGNSPFNTDEINSDLKLKQDLITGDNLINSFIQTASTALENGNALEAAEALEKGVTAMNGQPSNTTAEQFSSMTPEQLQAYILNNSIRLAIIQIQNGKFEDAVPTLGLFFSTIINNHEIINNLIRSVFSADATMQEQPKEEGTQATDETQALDALKSLNNLKEADSRLSAKLNTINSIKSQCTSFHEGIIALNLQLNAVRNEIKEIECVITKQKEELSSQNSELERQYDSIAQIDRKINNRKVFETITEDNKSLEEELKNAKSKATNFKIYFDENQRVLVDLENTLREKQLALAESQAYLARIERELELNNRVVKDLDTEITIQHRSNIELTKTLCQLLNDTANNHYTRQSNIARESSAGLIKNVA